MTKQAQEIYNELRKKGFWGEALVSKMIAVGEVVLKRARNEERQEFFDLAFGIFDSVAVMAKGQGFGVLARRANKLAAVANPARGQDGEVNENDSVRPE